MRIPTEKIDIRRIGILGHGAAVYFSDLRNATSRQMRIFSVLMFGNTKFFALFLPLADRELRAPFFGTKGKNIFGTKRLRKQSWNLFQVNLVPNPFFEKFIPDENSV